MIALMATLLEMDWLRRRDLDHMAAQFVILPRLRCRGSMQLIASGNPVRSQLLSPSLGRLSAEESRFRCLTNVSRHAMATWQGLHRVYTHFTLRGEWGHPPR